MITIDQDQIDNTLLNMTIDLSGLTFDGGEIRSHQLSQDERDLLLAALNTLMSQRRQNAVSNRYWANHPNNGGVGIPAQGPGTAAPIPYSFMSDEEIAADQTRIGG